jgi:hypothetical protein
VQLDPHAWFPRESGWDNCGEKCKNWEESRAFEIRWLEGAREEQQDNSVGYPECPLRKRPICHEYRSIEANIYYRIHIRALGGNGVKGFVLLEDAKHQLRRNQEERGWG